MSTVSDIANAIAFRVNDTRFTRSTGLVSYAIPIINDMIRHIDMILFSERSDMAKTALTLTLTSGDATKALPDGFIGMCEEPWVTTGSDNSLLRPLPDRAQALSFSAAGEPRYYEIIGSTIHLYPATDLGRTLKGFYFKFSDAMATVDSTIPFNGIFDQLIKEHLVKAYHLSNTTRDDSGQMIAAIDPAQVSEFVNQVKLLLYRRQGRTVFEVRDTEFM